MRVHAATVGLLSVWLCGAAAGAWAVYDTASAPFGGNQILKVAYDASRGVYARNGRGELFRYSGAVWVKVPVDTAAAQYFFGPIVAHAGAVWQGTPWWGLVRVNADETTQRFDTANSCLPGSEAVPLGLDASGRLIVFSGRWYGLGGQALDVVRFDGTACESISIGRFAMTEYVLSTYSRDSAGVEWFVATCMSDVPTCGQLGGVYALRGDTLQRVLEQEYWLGAPALVSDREATYAACGAAIAVIGPDSTRMIDSVLGRGLRRVSCMLHDSRGALWVGTEGYTYDTVHIGLVRMTARDTVITNHTNSGFRGYFPMDMVEDGGGRIWIGTYLHGLWVYTYDDSAGIGTRNSFRKSGPTASERGRPCARSYDIRGRVLLRGTGYQGLTVWMDHGAAEVRLGSRRGR